MNLLSLLLGATAITAAATTDAPVPPPPRPPPSVHDVPEDAPREAIFTYRVDSGCRITDTRKLQGEDDVRWHDVAEARGVTTDEPVFRYVDGVRTRLRERRIKLLGEMVRTGELVCHVKPSGEVVEAWIERQDESMDRRRGPEREDVPLRDGRLPELGTFSLVAEIPCRNGCAS